MPVMLTDTAAREIRTIVTQQELDLEKVRLRVGVKGGGCSGFSYILDLTETQKEHDEMFDQHGIKVICDPKSYLYLNGVTIDNTVSQRFKFGSIEQNSGNAKCLATISERLT